MPEQFKLLPEENQEPKAPKKEQLEGQPQDTPELPLPETLEELIQKVAPELLKTYQSADATFKTGLLFRFTQHFQGNPDGVANSIIAALRGQKDLFDSFVTTSGIPKGKAPTQKPALKDVATKIGKPTNHGSAGTGIERSLPAGDRED